MSPASLIPTARTRLAAVIGEPIRHSLSPAIHNAAFRAAGLEWVFLAFEVPAVSGERILDAMDLWGIEGLAVTTPHKQEIARALAARDPNAIDPTVRALDSVNTLMRRGVGHIVGASTDGDGFIGSVREVGVDVHGLTIAVLGAGAAARSVIDALDRAEAADIIVINRSPAAAQTACDLSTRARIGTVHDVSSADLVVNATTVGMDRGRHGDADASPVPATVLGAHQVVADLVYHPLHTRLLRDARQAGAETIDGLGMLVHQAALQQRLWTGLEPDLRAMRAAAEAELSATRR